MDSHVSLLVAIGGLLVGGGGVWTFALVAYRSGKFTEKLERIEKALNGPIQKQFDSAKRQREEIATKAQAALEAMQQRSEMCGRHEANLQAVTESVVRIEKRMETRVSESKSV